MHEKRLTDLATALTVSAVKFVYLAAVAAAPLAAGCTPPDAVPYGGNGSNASGGGAGGVYNGAGAGVGVGATGSTGATSSVVNQPPGTAEWCAVMSVLEKNCQTCHNENLAFGAPMTLLTHDDLLAPAHSDGRPVYEVMLERVTSATKAMPPPPYDALSAGDIATLQAWVAADTPNGDCSAPTNGTGGTSGGGGTGSGGTISGGGTGPTGGSAGASNPDDYPPDCIDCGDYACTDGYPVAFRAHQNAVSGDKQPFDASTIGADGNPNSYECFYFSAPWGDATQMLGHRPIIDDERVLHHWLLYASNTPPIGLTDGGRASHCQFQPDSNRVLLAGWAPGAPGNNMPPNVGQALPDGTNVIITLEVHYFNTNPGAPAPDRSGVEVCLTDTPLPNEATMHWLGTENINIPPNAAASASDTCTPNKGQTSTILAVWPHEHLTGVHTKLEVFHANGTSEIVQDGPFDFNSQYVHWLDTPVVVNPGDYLRATCDFQNNTAQTVNFGEGSNEEMCYLFTMAYPAGSLHNGKNGCLQPLGCVPGGINRCIDNENILTAIGGL